MLMQVSVTSLYLASNIVIFIEEATKYKCFFPAMINDWRQKWYEGTDRQTDPMFPFGFVQVSYFKS